MADTEAETLIELGYTWWRKIWCNKGGSQKDRDEIIERSQSVIQSFGVSHTLSRGWQPYDPVIRRGRPETYKVLINKLIQAEDGGKNAAIELFNWFSGEGLLKDLSPELQNLAIICCVAEVGRGYESTLDLELLPWLLEITKASTKEEAKALWLSFEERFTPSVKGDGEDYEPPKRERNRDRSRSRSGERNEIITRFKSKQMGKHKAEKSLSPSPKAKPEPKPKHKE